MVITALRMLRLRSEHMYIASMVSILMCVVLWLRAKAVDQDERGNAERRALFIGLWPPMFWLMGRSLEEHDEHRPTTAIKRRRRRWVPETRLR